MRYYGGLPSNNSIANMSRAIQYKVPSFSFAQHHKEVGPKLA
ncbi:35403_t:CDS:2, partial [Gigaspora margarita]